MKKQMSPLINAVEVREIIDAVDVVLVDARGGADATERYAAGHLPGAHMVNLETELSGIGPDAALGGRHPLPDPKRFSVLLGKLGIAPASRILVYDDKAGANAAARFWWMVRAAGHHRIQVIDGGLAGMQQAGINITKGSPPMRADWPPYPFTAWTLPLANIDSIDHMRSGNETLVIDVRESYRYRGESEPIDLVAGHIPGAINIPYVDNLEANGSFRPAKQLAGMYKEAIGDREVRNVAVHCGSGVTACHTILAMDAAGMPMPQLYVGSWSEWSRNPKPVAKGPNP